MAHVKHVTYENFFPINSLANWSCSRSGGGEDLKPLLLIHMYLFPLKKGVYELGYLV